MAGKGILLDKNNDLMVQNGSMIIADSVMQEVALILQINQGEQKFMPLLGPNLIQEKLTNLSRFEIEQRVKVHLELDNKDYNQLKKEIQTYIK